jgi:hypothetical protein
MLKGNLASSKLFLAGNSSWVSLSKCLIINLPQVAHVVSYLRQVTNHIARQSCRDFFTWGLSIFCSFVPNDCDDVHRTAFGCWRLPFGFARWAESGRCSTPACGRDRQFGVVPDSGRSHLNDPRKARRPRHTPPNSKFSSLPGQLLPGPGHKPTAASGCFGAIWLASFSISR